ncbi:MAG: ligase-associated DNA damage response DEXH box helicase [Sphingomonadaceae bacterium]|uniref:ligase-associated DNA damage response DEXH box helicase n=1 Tax=Thermaurantiacus sp. TaxID=2820283 RepID=UPI00298F0B42|nr:ligase-associated DNA damage response DEXH box helicase [Thermaurantiacus sp.]MCS6987443.1 ligase-associated DNA damage response DEXH box helicase [Sphingomonadaceae bacterium]MDW8415363.1 ligase-associated DNA damage response DEXH box helicase [Thermaurantiacus sp.]
MAPRAGRGQRQPADDPGLPPALAAWFARRGWRLRRHQREMLAAAREGAHVLLVAPTGAGKTLAGFLPVLAEAARGEPRPGLKAIHVSPLKALAHDIARNLLTPVTEAGLPLRVETRTGDTPQAARQRQRADPPDILVTTPESLSLLLTWPDTGHLVAGLETVVVDEIHELAPTKRGDLVALALARLQALAPKLRRVGLSATVAEPLALARWLAPVGGDARILEGEEGPAPIIHILVPGGRIPWSGHNGRHAAAEVMRLIEAHRQTVVFVNTRAVAELVFRDLWAVNDRALPIGIHHGSLSREARTRCEAALAQGRLRAVVATSSLDLGIDWGDVDLVVQMGAPKGAARLIQRTGRANHRLEEPSRAIIVPGNRFEYLEALAAVEAVADRDLEPLRLRPGGLDVLAQHVTGLTAAGPVAPDALFAEVRTASPYAGLDRRDFDRVIDLVATGGYALRAYERFRRIVPTRDGRLRLAHPRLAARHRANAGVIVEAPAVEVRLGRGRKLGTVEEWFASQLRPGDSFAFAGINLEVTGMDERALFTRLSRKPPAIPTYVGGRMPLATNLAERVRSMLADPATWTRMPPDVQEWLELQRHRSVLPSPDRLLVETFPRAGLHYLVLYGFEGRNAHQALGMLLTQRMERAGRKPLGFVASDYALAVWSLCAVERPADLFAGDIVGEELKSWIEATPFLRRAFRDVAVISGLVPRGEPGRPKAARALVVSTDLVFEVLRRHEPGHLLLEEAWTEARRRLTDVERLAALLERARARLLFVPLTRPSPLSLPVLLEAGREQVPGVDEDELLAAVGEPPRPVPA